MTAPLHQSIDRGFHVERVLREIARVDGADPGFAKAILRRLVMQLEPTADSAAAKLAQNTKAFDPEDLIG